MRHTVKALRLIIVVLWIAVLLLPVTVAFSLWKIFEADRNVGIGELSFSMPNGNFSISVPFYMNNTGFYDISELCANIRLFNGREEIVKFSTQPLNIPAGKMVTSSLNASVSLEDVHLRDMELLIRSKDLNVGVVLHFRVAYILAFDIARNFTYKWGAPFSNLTITYVGGNATHISFSVSFYNNASFPLSGPLKFELYNLQNASIGSVVKVLDLPPDESYKESFTILMSNAAEGGIIRLFFANIPIFEQHWGPP